MEERRRLTKLQIAVSLFEVVGTSYISEKLTYCYEVWYPKYLTNQLKPQDPNNAWDVYSTGAKRRFVEIYPYLQSVVRAGNFATTLMYLAGATKGPSLLTYLFKIDYSRLNSYDYDINDPEKQKDKTGKNSDSVNRISPPTNLEYLLRLVTKNFTKPSWKIIKLVLGTFFPIAIFTLKFLEWWNNSDFTQKLAKSLGNLLESMLPPPSTLSQKREQQDHPTKIYQSGKHCPICKKEISNPAIIETGYVFCYSCIYNYLSESHKLKKVTQDENETEDDEDDEDENEEKGNENGNGNNNIDIFRGGRCPITGKKLLGCKWNELKQDWDIEGIRRLIF